MPFVLGPTMIDFIPQGQGNKASDHGLIPLIPGAKMKPFRLEIQDALHSNGTLTSTVPPL